MQRDTDTKNELQRPDSETALVKVESEKRPQGIDIQSERQLTRRQAATSVKKNGRFAVFASTKKITGSCEGFCRENRKRNRHENCSYRW